MKITKKEIIEIWIASALIFVFLIHCKAQVKPTNLQKLEFVQIPEGSFIMGADIDYKYIAAGKEEKWRSIFIQDEFPQRKIHITQSFEISKYEKPLSIISKFKYFSIIGCD